MKSTISTSFWVAFTLFTLRLSSLTIPLTASAFQIQPQLQATGSGVSRVSPLSSLHRQTSCNDVNEYCGEKKSGVREQDRLDDVVMGRRKFWAKSAIVAAGASFASFSPLEAAVADTSVASTLKMEPYEDTDYKFRFNVPSTWEKSEQDISGRRKAVFFVDGSNGGSMETLVFVAYTPVRDDFTSLASFGTADEVGQATILPKGELSGSTVKSRMISATSKNNAYTFDYVIDAQSEGTASSTSAATASEQSPKKQHYRTIFTLLPKATGSAPLAGLTLVTITAQTTEEKYSAAGGELKKVFDDIINSYSK